MKKKSKGAPAFSVDTLSLKELVDLETKVKRAIAAARDKERNELKRKVTELAQNHGFSVNELFGAARGARGGAKGKSLGIARYANPDDSSDTWTGRGRKPNWLLERLKKGGKLDDFAI